MRASNGDFLPLLALTRLAVILYILRFEILIKGLLYRRTVSVETSVET